MRRVVLWDFDGTLAHRDGMWSGCLADALTVSAAGFEGIRSLLERPLADSRSAGLTPASSREALAVVESVYAYHGGFRLRTLARR